MGDGGIVDYKEKKVMSIGIVRELTGLSERKIRYYEERKLITPVRSEKGTRLYSFTDIEALAAISRKVEKGAKTYDLRQEMRKEEIARKALIQEQVNAHFGISQRQKRPYV